MKRFKKRVHLITVEELIKKAKVWDKRYLDAVVHSLELYDSEERSDLVQKFLSKKNRGAFKLTNPYSKRLWLPALMGSFLASRRKWHGRDWKDDFQDYMVACALVTFTDKKWTCPDTDIQFDLTHAKQKVRNALEGADFIASFDAAVYRNENFDSQNKSGKLISFHCHAIVWTGSESGIRRWQRRVRKRFTPILGNKHGIHVKAIKSEGGLARTTAYIAKMPTLGYRTARNGKGKTTQRHTPMTFSSRRNLFHALKRYSTFDFWLGGGEGARVLRDARNPLEKKYAPKRPKSPF